MLCESCYDALHKQATTLADVVKGDIYIGMANNSNWAQVRRKLDTAVPNATFNPGSSMQFDSTTVQGAFITFTAIGRDDYFTDARATNFEINIHDIHTVPLAPSVDHP